MSTNSVIRGVPPLSLSISLTPITELIGTPMFSYAM